MEYKVDYDARSVMQEFLDENPDNALDMSYDAMSEISLAFSDYRRGRGLSQKEMAEILDVSQPMVSKIESGEYNFSIEELCKICDKIGWRLKVNLDMNMDFHFMWEPNDIKTDYLCESEDDRNKQCKIYHFSAWGVAI